MGDVPSEWEVVRDLPEGGQGHTFVVRRSDGSDGSLYVLKRLKNLKREAYFEREIRACETLDHPNVLKVIDHGRTPKGKPFLITQYCDGGSLGEHRPRFTTPGLGLRFFQAIVAGVAYAHSHQPPIYHLDLKPENIFLKHSLPVVGDFGICFIEDREVTFTSEGPRGSLYYCAPELRNPRISGEPPLAAADVYSLGKILYWLFTEEVYDGHEEEYANRRDRHLSRIFNSHPQFAFIDDLILKTVQREPTVRLPSAVDLWRRVQDAVDRIEAGGRVLDLRIPQRCIYCAFGHYHPIHELMSPAGGSTQPSFPDIKTRSSPPQDQFGRHMPSIYETMIQMTQHLLGSRGRGAPLFLICDYCGNVQYFRLDLTEDKRGGNWRP